MIAIDTDYVATANARFRTPSMVARTFVPPDQFQKLTRDSHTVMVGPRGSGKTTLLKMLTPEALQAASEAKRFRLEHGLHFTGVFIPSDIAWSRQVETFSRWELAEETVAGLFEASFTASVLRNFATAIHERLTREIPATWLNVPAVKLTNEEETTVAVALAGIWNLNLRVPSFLGLRAAASERIVDLGRAASKAHLDDGSIDRAEILAQGDLIPQLTLALDTLEALVPTMRGEKWCLMFDELELAPAEIRRSLISSMRSVDDRLILKLAISPYSDDLSDLRSAMAAMPGHDHEEIWLSYGHKSDGVKFSFALMHEVVRERLGQDASLESLLGGSIFPSDDPGSNSDKPLTAGAQDEYIRDLYDLDSSFRAYADRVAHGIDGLMALTGQERSQHVRKVIPLAIVRVAFRTPDESSPRRYRGRKNPRIYAGSTALAAILEGNPRWIIGVMNALLDSKTGRVSAARQNAEVARLRNRFRSLLSTIPVPISKETRRGLLQVVDSIGEAFRYNIIAADFSPDPVGSFVVDSNASDEFIKALGSAVNTGAIVYVPDADSSGLLTSMRGKRFRLSYLLATGYQLPLRLERGASLRSILSQGPANDQLELFDEY